MNKKDNIVQDVIRMKSVDNPLSYTEMATVINKTYGTNHTGSSIRGIWRRNVRQPRQFIEPTKPSRYKRFVPVSLNGKNALFIGDTHFPFVKTGYLEFLDYVRKHYNLTEIFHAGDVNDEYAQSLFEKDPDSISAKNELLAAKDCIEYTVSLFPWMKIVIGNHDNRHLRMAKKAGLPEAYIRDFLEIFNLPDTWVWHQSYLIDNEIVLEHGTASGGNATTDRAWALSKNVIQGHTHNYGGVSYMNNGLKTVWALNVGCGIDADQYAFHYATERKFQPTLGCGILVDGIPQFIPFNG